MAVLPLIDDKKTTKEGSVPTRKKNVLPLYSSKTTTKKPVPEKKTIGEKAKSAGKFVLNLGKEAVLAPVRALAAPAAILSEDIPGLITGQKSKSNVLSKFAFGETEPGTPERSWKAMERALDAALLPMGGNTAKQIVKEATKKTTKEALKIGLKQALKPKEMLKDVTLGSAYGLTSAKSEGLSNEEVAKRTALGGTIGLVAPLVLGAGFKGAGFIAKGTTKQLGKTVESLSGSIDAVAERLANKAEDTYLARDFAIAKGAKNLSDFINIAKKLPNVAYTGFIDPSAPVASTSKTLKELTGKDVDLANIMDEVSSKAGGKIADYEVGFSNIIKEAKNIGPTGVKDFVELARLRDYLDRLKLGQKIEGDLTEEQVTKRLSDFITRLSPEALENTSKLHKQLQESFTQVLDDALKVGRISQEQFNAFRKAHPNFLPHEAIDFLENPSRYIKETGLQGKGFEKAVGSVRKLRNPLESTINYYRKQVLANHQADAARRILKEYEEAGLEKFGIEKKGVLPEAQETNIFERAKKTVDFWKEGKETFTILEDGEKITYSMPLELGHAFKNLDPEDINLLGSITESIIGKWGLQAPASFLKKTATQYNPLFLIRNPIRDFQNARITSNLGVRDMVNVAYGQIADIIAPNSGAAQRFKSAMKEAELSGGIIGTGFFNQGRNAGSILSKSLDNGNILSRVIRHPLRSIEDLGGGMENGTRLAVFLSEIRQGSTLEQAAKMSRNATADFSKAGRWTKELNKIIPYLNARIRGVDALAKAVNRDPVGTMRKAIFNSIYPAIILNRMNTQYESYQNIPSWERKSYWIIMTGELPGKSAQGERLNIPLYIKIPKGEAQQIFSAITDRMLDTTPKESLPDFIKEIATNVSPVSLDQGIVGAIMPTGIKLPIELATNYSFFRKKPLIPEYVPLPTGKTAERESVPKKYQVDYTTSELAKTLGEILNVSPAKLDNIIKQGVLSDVLNGMDIILKGEKKKEGITVKGKSAIYDLSTTPGLRMFFGSNYYGQILNENEQELLKKQEQIEEIINRALNKERP